MKKFYLLLITLFVGGYNLVAQINPANSPYVNNGIYSVIQDSATVGSKKVVMYRPNIQPLLSKYPVFIFQPGANGFMGGTITVHTYDLYLKHLVTYGFVVLVIDEVSSTGMPNGATFKSVHTWFKQQTAGTHWLHTYADSNKVVIGGHSNGGVNASGLLIERPTEIDGIVYFASYPSNNFLLPMDVSGYAGKVLDMAGSEDQASTPVTCKEGYNKFTSATCRTWVQITGMAHGGFGDYVNTSQPVGTIGRANATASVKHFLLSFMMGQYKNDNTAANNMFVAANRPNTTGEFETTCGATTTIENVSNAITNAIYPNPTSGKCTISLTLTQTSNVKTDIINCLGQVIYTSVKLEQNGTYMQNINIEHYPKGVYFVNIKAGAQYIKHRLINQ